MNCIILRIFFIKAVSTCSHVKPACCLKWTWWGGTENIQSTHSPNSMKTVMDKLCSSSCAIIWFYSFQYTFITRSSNSFSSKINDFLCRFWSLPSMVGKGNDNKHFNSLTDLYQTVKLSNSNAAWLIWDNSMNQRVFLLLNSKITIWINDHIQAHTLQKSFQR